MLLTQRTNVLLSEADYKMLKELSKEKNQSICELIRHAVTNTFKESRPTRSQALAKLKKLGKKINTKGINIKELVEYGRR